MAVEFNFAIVGFLDVLGYRAMVNADAQAATPQHLPRILEAISVLDNAGMQGVELRLFSDSFVLSAEFGPGGLQSVVKASASLQRALAIKKIWLRGGIAHGKHYVDERAIFSQALVHAYEIESAIARVPRVVIDPGLLDLVGTHPDLSSEMSQALIDGTLRDRDRHVFVNYLNSEFAEAHADAIQSILTGDLEEPGLREKALWLVEYHNFCCDELNLVDLRIQGVPTGFEKRA